MGDVINITLTASASWGKIPTLEKMTTDLAGKCAIHWPTTINFLLGPHCVRLVP